MRWIITEPDGVESALGPESRFREEPAPSCLEAIAQSASLTRTERLDVYAEAYFIRLCKTLEEDFLSVRRWLGEDSFRGLVSDYLLEHPSRRPDLIELGRSLPGFLASWLEPGEAPFLADLASLDWACAQAYFALDPRAWDPAVLAGDAESARLSLAPATRLIESQWAIDELRARLRGGESPELAPPARRLTRLVVFREQGRVGCEAVSEGEHRLLGSAARALSLGEACESLSDHPETTAEALFQWLSKWASRGALVCDKA
jgi:hypothetical protein